MPGRWLICFLKNSNQELLKAENVAHQLSQLVPEIIKRGDSNAILLLGADVHLYKSLKELTPQDLSEIARTFDLIMKDNSPVGTLASFQNIHRVMSKEVECFSGPKGARHTLRLDEINAREQMRRKGNKESLDRLLLVDTPFLIAGSVRDCNVPPEIMANFDHVYRLVEQGVSPGLAAINEWFFPAGRLNYIARSMNSPSLLGFAGLQQMIAAQKATGFLLESIRYPSVQDFHYLSSMMTEFAVEDLKEGQIADWIRTRLPKSIQGQAFEVLKELQKPHFHDFIDLMAIKYPMSEALLREALTDSDFRRRSSDAFFQLTAKALSPELRPQLVNFLSAMARSWESKRGGIGPLMSILTESSFLAEENPFQFWVRSLFADRDFQKKWFQTTSRMIKTPEFKRAVEFTAKFAESDQYDGFLRFLIDIFRYSDQKGLQTGPIAGGYKGPGERNYGQLPTLPLPQKPEPNIKYASCRQMNGGLWDPGGEVFYNALKCLGGDRPEHGLSQIAELLKQSGDLHDFSDLVGRNIFNRENAHAYLSDLQLLQKSGDLAALMEFLIKSRRIGPDVIADSEQVLARYLSKGTSAQALESSADILKSKNLGEVVYTVLDMWEREDDQRFFKSDSHFVMPVQQPEEIIKQAMKKVPGADINQARRALKSFTLRDANYFYDQEIYENVSEANIQVDVNRMLGLLLRYSREANTGDVEEFIKALREIWEWHRVGRVNMTEFIRWGTSSLQAVPYYVGEQDRPQVRFVTPFDQLDLLVANSDYSVAGWLPFAGVDHLGTYFQIQVAESTNLAETLENLRVKMSRVVDWGKPFIDRGKYNHLKNNLENFTVLEEANRRGHLVILQRLYRAFYYSTPPRDRRAEDVQTNHMSLVHQPTRWAMFSRMVSGLRHVDSQGQLEHFVGILGQLLRSLAPGDESAVRLALDNLMLRSGGNFSSMDYALSVLFDKSKDPAAFDKIKDQIYHALFATGRNIGRGRVLFEVLSNVNARLTARILERYQERLARNSESDLLLISRWASLDPQVSKIIRGWSLEVSNLTTRARTQIGELLTPMIQVMNDDEQLIADLAENTSKILKHPEVQSKNIKATLRRIFNEYQMTKSVIPQILANPRDRQTTSEIALNLAREKRFQALADAFIEVYESGQLNDLLTLINDYSRYQKR